MPNTSTLYRWCINVSKNINALKRASSISAEFLSGWSAGHLDVSMPLNGLHPFLHETDHEATVTYECINALKRATSISTNVYFEFHDEKFVCQCPLTGYIHFYGKALEWTESKTDVSMPFNGLHPFLQKKQYNH